MTTCQYCQTELTNPRAKNCQTCSTLLSEANKRGTYGFVMDAIRESKERGVVGAEMHEVMRLVTKLGASYLADRQHQQKVADRQRSSENAQREQARLKFFQDHGYWPDQVDEEDEGEQPPARGTWYSDQDEPPNL